MIDSLTFVTSSPEKVKQLSQHLEFPVLHKKFDLIEIQSLDAAAIIEHREGSIALTPRGCNGFGWDSIFIPNGYDKTWGEMTDQESQETSMRMIALKKLEVYLKAL